VVAMAFRIVVQECDASACGYRCLHACPLGVFLAVPLSSHNRGLPKKPDRYVITPRFSRYCNACGLCVEVCPERAISLQC
jgi:formate hydrogenlyase subunit 6/NADH:ubiquinone oxidoreductase subunit I